MIARVRLVARSAAMLADLGVPGAVDPMVFGAVTAPPRAGEPSGKRPRIAVFIPPVRGREDKARWEMLDWLRGQEAFLRVLYPGRLPSPHIANVDEHLAGIVGEWDGWWEDLDGLFFWGAEGRMRHTTASCSRRSTRGWRLSPTASETTRRSLSHAATARSSSMRRRRGNCVRIG